MKGWQLWSAGLVLAVIAAGGAWLPFLRSDGDQLSLSTAHGICSTPLGQFAQATSAHVQADCAAITAGYWAALLTGIAGLVMILAGIIRVSRESRQSAGY